MKPHNLFSNRWILLSVGLLVISLLLINAAWKPVSTSGKEFDLMQIASSLLAIGMILFLISRTNHLQKTFIEWNRFIDESNSRYIFDSKEEIDPTNSEAIKARFLSNLEQATNFIKNISKGNYNVSWQGLDEKSLAENQGNIAGELVSMREQMKAVKEQDEIRLWLTEGLNKFGDLIRKHQNNSTLLFDQVISSAVNYVDAKVGGLFLVEEKNERKVLQLKASYAYSRKKYLEREIEIGNGLISECYLEGQTLHLKKIPKNYITITSGLGDATPTALLLIPLKTNDTVEGILEIASLNEFKPHHIKFLEQMAESLGASIHSIRVSENTKELLAVSQSQAEEMRAQEEEMRQNMEELEATQEQMNRQVNELNQLKGALEQEKYLFAALMDNLPDTIYYKDRQCKLIRVSKFMATAFNTSIDKLIGKSDFDFQDEAHAQEAYDDEQRIMATRTPKINFIEKETFADGSVRYVSSTKMPLIDSQGEVVGTFGISRDVTNFKMLEHDLGECRQKMLALQEELSDCKGQTIEKK
jgi:PAS domain S-box-containing protein